MAYLSLKSDFAERALDRITLMIAYWDRDLRCRYANPAYLASFGKNADEVIGGTLDELLGAELYALNEPYIRAALAGEPQMFERPIPSPDGGAGRHGLARYHPDVVDGMVLGFVVEVADVDGIKSLGTALQSEIALKQRALAGIAKKEAALEAAQALGQMGSWEWEIAADITSWSSGLYRLFGRNPALLPPSFAEHCQLYTPESWQRLQDAVAAAVSLGTPYTLELEYVRPDGSTGWLEGRGEVERDSEGLVVGLHGTAQDCTERHNLLAALQTQTQRLESALELGRLGLWKWDLETGQFEPEDDRACAILGVDTHAAGVLDGETFFTERLHPEDEPAFRRACLRLVERHQDDMAFVGRLIHSGDGESIWIRCAGVAIECDGVARMVRGTVIDVTEVVLVVQALQNVANAYPPPDAGKSEFLFALAHELRNCIAPLSGGLQLLQKRLAAPVDEKVGAIMARQIAHMARLVDDVYDIRRIETGEFELRLGRLSLNDVVMGALDMCTSRITHARHRLRVALPDHEVMATGDGMRLTQCLVNLVSNACKFTPPGGNIHVALTVESGEVAVLSVRDSGIGMAPDELDSIFGLYVQVGAAAGRPGAGLGIGLHLVKQMVELHGGTVHAMSQGPGKGSTLTIRLPLD